MVRSRKQLPRSIVLNQQVKIEVTEASFRVFDSLGHLDAARLHRAARAKFEVGTFETSCGHRTVHAVVRKGMVTELELEPCKDRVRMTPELKKVLDLAAKKLASRRRGSTSLPIPVSEFLESPLALTISVWGCMKICCFGHCIICCFHIPGTSKKWIWAGCALDKYPLP